MRDLIFPLFFFTFSVLKASAACAQNNACPTQLQENFIQNSLQATETMKQSQGFQSFLTQSNQQRDAALEDKNFQEIIAKLQAQIPTQIPQFKPLLSHNTIGELYVFVSFSMGEKALLNLAQEAKTYGATLILRGFKACPRPREGGEHGEQSYVKTVQALQGVIQKTGQGFLIDPDLFTLFGITTVPTYVVAKPLSLSPQERSQTPLHDRLQGHVSIRYALETFAKEGDLQKEAHSLLINASQEKERHQ